MFDLQPGDELDLLALTTRKFAEERLAPAMRDAEAARGPTDDVRAAWAAVGLADLELPEARGGAGLGSLARVLVNEELGAADAGAALALDPFGPALYAGLELGGDEALELLREAAADPRARPVLALEPIDRPDSEVSLEAAWVPAGRVSGVAILGPSRALFVTEGIEATPVPGAGLRAAGASRLVLRGAPVRASFEHGAAAARARARARLYVASLLLGVLRASNDFSRAYALERRAFGRPIAHHQALAFLIVDMQMALESARLLVHEAAWRLDAGLPATAEAAGAFAECVAAARFIGPAGVQILGGHGFMQDYPVEKHMREARALGLLAGGLDLAAEEAGLALCAEAQPLALDALRREAS